MKAGAPNMATALRAAGYAPKTIDKVPHQVLGAIGMREQLVAAIESMNVHARFKDNWNRIMDLDAEKHAGDILKAQDQIARIAGLEANKRIEKAVVTYNIESMLPKGDVVKPRDDAPALIAEGASPSPDADDESA